MAGAVTGQVRQSLARANGEFLAVARIQALDELARAVRAGDAGMAKRIADLVVAIEDRMAKLDDDAPTLERRLTVAARAGLPGGHFSA